MSRNGVDVQERPDVTNETQQSVDDSVVRQRIRTAPVKANATTTLLTRPAPAIGRATVRPPRTRVSLTSTASLVIGVAAVLATLTGLLAPLGVISGGLAVLFSLFGFAMLRHGHVNGYGINLLGLLLGVAAVGVGLLAVQGELSWLSSDTDQVARVHAWLGEHASWLNRW